MNQLESAVGHVQPYRYSSPDIPLAAIRRFARTIADRFAPEKIILFGSYGYGTPHAESDVDLLVIMPCANVVNQAIRIDLAFERPFSLDLIVRTPKQVERGLQEDNWFLREIVEKGKVLYEAPNGPVGSQGRRGLGRGARPGRAKAAPQGPGLLPLPTKRRKVLQGLASRTRRSRSENT
jgi:predicted nucleotidyltransferase